MKGNPRNCNALTMYQQCNVNKGFGGSKLVKKGKRLVTDDKEVNQKRESKERDQMRHLSEAKRNIKR